MPGDRLRIDPPALTLPARTEKAAMKVRTASKSAKSPFNIREWMATEDGYILIEEFAAKFAGFSFGPAEDMVSELALALLEREAECPKTKPARLKWIERVAEETANAVGRRNRPAKATGSLSGVSRDTGDEFNIDVVDAAAADLCHDAEPEFTHAFLLMEREKELAKRVKKALAKLTDQHRQAITDRYFTGKVLSDEAAKDGKCDSSHRMRLLRAKKKLSTLIDADAYALAA